MNDLKNKLVESSKKYKDRTSLTAFLAQLSMMVQAKIDACGEKTSA